MERPHTKLRTALLLLLPPLAALHADRPNILFLNADDLGWTDTGFMGSAYYETPHLDALAASGMVFTRAYAAAANCAPSRASMYSGQALPRHGVYTVKSSVRGKAAHRQLIPTPNTQYLDPAIPTFPRLLQQAGYQTVHVGKWHIGDDPTRAGFDLNIGGYEWGHPVHGYFSPYKIPGFEDGPAGEYLTERLARDTVEQIHALDPARSFFISYQFYSPHTPIQAKAERVARFARKSTSPTHAHATYAAMISHLDDVVGQLINTLEERNLLENTVIIFASDNGALHNFSSQAPLRGEKGSYYEGGIRVPLVVSWRGHIQPGSRSKIPVTNLDFFPTILELADIPRPKAMRLVLGSSNFSPSGVYLPPEDHPLDGHSLVPLLTGQGTLPADRELVWHFPIYLQQYQGPSDSGTRDYLFRTRPGSVIRVGPWKLHQYFEDGGLELYHLEADPGERRNLAELHPEKTLELRHRLEMWRQRLNAPVPTEPNPHYDPEAETQALRAWMP